MKTFNINRFLEDESGASVVDMTVLMSFLCAIAIAVMVYIGNGLDVLANDIEDEIVAQDANAAWE